LEEKDRKTFQAAWHVQEGKACDHLIGQAKAKIDLAFAASKAEVRSLGRRHKGLPIEYLPNAIALQGPFSTLRRDTLLFVGTLGYLPNGEGLLWFMEHVLPRIRRHHTCRVVIIGRRPPASLRAAARRVGVLLLDRVDNLEPYYRSASAVIAPMRSGGGTRIKLMEAASFGVASIATPEAAAGLYSAARPWGWIANGPQQFADACLEALTDAKRAAGRAAAGRSEVSRHFDRAKIVRQLAQRFKKLIDERERRSD
jgi:glycosyltransferase involved in cell wall biosynthesis